MIITIFGKTGTGKTYLSRQLARIIQRKTKLDIFEYSPFEQTEFDELDNIYTNSILIINEMQIFQLQLPEAKMLEILTGHRHYNLYIIANSQRPAMVRRNITALSEKIYSFRITEERDLDYMRFFGCDVEVLRNLPDFHCVDIMTQKVFDLTNKRE